MEENNLPESVELEVDALQPNPLQPRGQIMPDTLVELAESIREHGLLEPIVVAKTPAGYQIIAGERRWRASKLAGLTRVPCVVRETTPQGMLEMAIVENVQRVDLNPLERAQAYLRLIEEFGMSPQEIATRVGKSGPYISNTLRLLDLPDAIKDGLLSNTITEGHCKAILGLTHEQMIQAYKIIIRDGLGTREAEELARRMKAQSGIAPRTERVYVHSPNVEKMEKNISDTFACKVKLLKSQRSSRLLMVFDNEDNLNKALEKLVGTGLEGGTVDEGEFV